MFEALSRLLCWFGCDKICIPTSGLHPSISNSSSPFPIGFTRLFSIEFLVDGSGGVDQASAMLPSPAAFLELARTGVFRALAFTRFPVPSIELERHGLSSAIVRHCTLALEIVCKAFRIKWRRGGDSNPR